MDASAVAPHIDRVFQPSLFADSAADPPPGMDYAPDFLAPHEEVALIRRLSALPFAPFAFHGFEGLRRVVSYGWRYDFSAGRGVRVEAIPDWLQSVRDQAGQWAGLEPAVLEQALITEYRPGAPIGWHRDRPMFDAVIGVSLGSPCSLRFRRRSGSGWARRAVPLAPRSIYRLGGEARWAWEHSIGPADALRYSITFRSLSDR